MEKHISRFIRWFRRGLRVLLGLLIVSILPKILTIFFEGKIEDLLSLNIKNLNKMIFWIIENPWLLPFTVLAAYFIWAFYMVVTSHNWDDVFFKEWLPNVSEEVIGGIKIINDKNEDIEDCEVEVMAHTIALPNWQPLPVGQAFEDMFPLSLCWIINNEKVCATVTIGSKRERHLGMVYKENEKGKREISMQGKNTRYVRVYNPASYTMVRIAGKIAGKPLEPMYKVVAVRIQGYDKIDLEIRDARKDEKEQVAGIQNN